MKQIRVGVFETNSSSTHSITVCTKEEYEKLESGNYEGLSDNMVESYTEYVENDYLESYKKTYKTPNGEEIVIFGNYGQDG